LRSHRALIIQNSRRLQSSEVMYPNGRSHARLPLIIYEVQPLLKLAVQFLNGHVVTCNIGEITPFARKLLTTKIYWFLKQYILHWDVKLEEKKTNSFTFFSCVKKFGENSLSLLYDTVFHVQLQSVQDIDSTIWMLHSEHNASVHNMDGTKEDLWKWRFILTPTSPRNLSKTTVILYNVV